MLFNWKGIGIVLATLAAVIVLCAIDLSCGAKPAENSTIARVKGELDAGRKEARQLQAEDLARLARDMRTLADHYGKTGEKKKALQAVNAARELERKIRKLRGE